MLGFYAEQVSDGRDQQHVLPPAEGERAARLGVAGARRVHVRDQGEPAHHALRAAQAGVRRAPSSSCSRTPSTLGDRLGPILFQLPPNLKKDVDRACARSSTTLPADRRYTIEFRHESWFDDDVSTRCARATFRSASPSSRTSRRRCVSTASWGYLRLHRFDYDTRRRAEWSRRASRRSRGATRSCTSSTTKGSGPARRRSACSSR